MQESAQFGKLVFQIVVAELWPCCHIIRKVGLMNAKWTVDSQIINVDDEEKGRQHSTLRNASRCRNKGRFVCTLRDAELTIG
jgi:hypothetical protein